MEANTTGVDVQLPAFIGDANELPVSSVNLFDFVFSQPFAPGAPVLDSIAPVFKRKYTVGLREPVPLNKPLFVDGKTGALVVLGEHSQAWLT